MLSSRCRSPFFLRRSHFEMFARRRGDAEKTKDFALRAGSGLRRHLCGSAAPRASSFPAFSSRLMVTIKAGLSHTNFSAVFQPFGLSLSKPNPFLQQKKTRSFDRLRTNIKDRPIPYAIPPPSRGGLKRNYCGVGIAGPDGCGRTCGPWPGGRKLQLRARVTRGEGGLPKSCATMAPEVLITSRVGVS